MRGLQPDVGLASGRLAGLAAGSPNARTASIASHSEKEREKALTHPLPLYDTTLSAGSCV
jgi:hypothetical protein